MSALKSSKTMKGRATKNTTTGKAATSDILDTEDERLRAVAHHLASLLYLDSTPADLHNLLYEHVCVREAEYLRHLKTLRPDDYAAHIFGVLKFSITTKGGAR